VQNVQAVLSIDDDCPGFAKRQSQKQSQSKELDIQGVVVAM
jgi:hypothetical protein